jgi:XTP/dITP diphosphohydrolase
MVSSARAAGLDAESALRSAVIQMQVEIREVELADASDAGVIALPSD